MKSVAGPVALPAPDPSPVRAVDAVSRRSRSIAQWRSTAPNAWVGSVSGRRMLGTVRRVGIDYVAFDARGGELGRYSALSDAESIVGSAVLEVATERDRIRQQVVVIVAAASGAVAVATSIVGLLVLNI